MYQTIKEKGEAVLNFPSADIYENCIATITNNGFDNDEIALSGLTAEQAKSVNAPCIKECFLNLECRYLWEREITDGDTHVLMCLEVVNVCARMAIITPNFNFAGRCEEAIVLYQKAFDAKVGCLLRYSDANKSDWDKELEPEQENYIYHAELFIGDQRAIFLNYKAGDR